MEAFTSKIVTNIVFDIENLSVIFVNRRSTGFMM
jgi:hypothetical protein